MDTSKDPTVRERLLDAAARVYAETGYRGATTRRIAQRAGVNEITLFRHFGSKTTLILEAVRAANLRDEYPRLPETPADPRQELPAWSRQQLAHFYRMRAIIRTCLGEIEERPEIGPFISQRASAATSALAAYFGQLIERGLTGASFDPTAAAALLMGALFADAMGRDVMPDAFPHDLDESADRYAELVLRAIGAADLTAHRPKRVRAVR